MKLKKKSRIENELQKEEINETEIQHIMEWLKENAEGIRNIAINIVAATLSGI